MTVLYHLGIMQAVVRRVAWVMQRTMRTSGAESLCAASNIFVGLMESPLVVKPFIAKMTESELLAIMTVGMATISGGVLAAYAGMMLPHQPEAAGHLIAASIMSAPAAFVMAKVMVPESATPETSGAAEVALPRETRRLTRTSRRARSSSAPLAACTIRWYTPALVGVNVMNHSKLSDRPRRRSSARSASSS